MSRTGRWVALAAGVLSLVIGSSPPARGDKFVPPLPARRDTLDNHVEDLLKYLRDTDSTRRSQAEYGLSALGPKAKAAVPVLVKMFADAEPERKRRFCDILGSIGPDARSALPLLIKALEGPDQAIKESEGRRFLGRRPPVWVESLHRSAADAIGNVGPDAKVALPALTKLLDDEKSHARDAVASAIWTITREPARVRTSFHQILKAPGPTGRTNALLFFREVGAADSGDIVPTLLAIARDPEETPHVVALAASTSWQFAKSKEAIPILLKVLRDNTDLAGSEFLAEIGTPAKAAIPILIDKVANFKVPVETYTQLVREASVKRRGADALGRFGPDAKAAGELLRSLLEHPSPFVKIDAAAALWRIEKSDPMLVRLNDQLRDKSPEVRLYVAGVLHDLGRVSEEAGPAIKELLRHEDFEIRDRAAELLKRIAPDAAKPPSR